MACLAVIPLALGACSRKSLSGVYNVHVSTGSKTYVAHIQADGNSFKGHMHRDRQPVKCNWSAFEGTLNDNVGYLTKAESWNLDDDGWRIRDEGKGLRIEFQWSKEGDTLRVTPRNQDDEKDLVFIGTKREGEKPFTGNLRDFPCTK